MNILQICFVYPPSFSGYGRQLQTINKEIAKSKNDVNIQVLTCFDKRYHSKNKTHCSITVNALFSNGRTSYKREGGLFYFFCLFAPLIFVRLFYKADLIHVVKAGPEAFLTLLIAKILRKNVIIKVAQDEMDSHNLKGIKKSFRKLRFNVITKATKVIAISTKIKKDLIKVGIVPKKIVSIPNAVDSNKFKPINYVQKGELRKNIFKDHNEDLESALHFLYLGSISRRKGVRDLLNALKYLKSTSKIVIGFVGPDYNEIKDFRNILDDINSSKDNISVYYKSFTENPQKFIQMSDCLILPSHSEGLPNVVLESLSCGVPVLVSDIPIHKEIITKDIGTIFSVGSEVDLLEKMNQIIINKEKLLEQGLNARELVEKKYSSKEIAISYYSLYKHCKADENK